MRRKWDYSNDFEIRKAKKIQKHLVMNTLEKTLMITFNNPT